MKQETLEEVAERILDNNIDGLRDALKDDDLFYFYKGVIQSYGEVMAKCQAKKMYSEEDLRESFKQSRQCKIFQKDMPPVYNTFEEWFNEFKKK